MTAQAIACINKSALNHNLQRAGRIAPGSRVMAVIKANAYGHGMQTAVEAFDAADAFAVGNIDEAQELYELVRDRKPIVVLQGVEDAESLALCRRHQHEIVVHGEHQVRLLESATGRGGVRVWLKFDTGMHRLGLAPNRLRPVMQRLAAAGCVDTIRIMSHLACADEPDRPENREQLDRFSELVGGFDGARSLCNSAGLVSFPDAHYEWVRPGIMLYGISPLSHQAAESLELKPAMTLKSRLIAINECRQGDRIGYGATWTCPERMQVGVVGLGYGDGYPRHAPSGTPVLIRGQQVPVIGRVSMDLVTVDLRGLPAAAIGDEVILWGDGLPIETIAGSAGTIGYELVCRLTSRVRYEVSG